MIMSLLSKCKEISATIQDCLSKLTAAQTGAGQGEVRAWFVDVLRPSDRAETLRSFLSLSQLLNFVPCGKSSKTIPDAVFLIIQNGTAEVCCPSQPKLLNPEYVMNT